MGTKDAPAVGSPGSELAARRDVVAPLAQESTWARLLDHMNVVIEPFATAEPGRGSDLHEPLAQAPEKFKNLLGIVLTSDGDWNEGPPPVQAASRRPSAR